MKRLLIIMCALAGCAGRPAAPTTAPPRSGPKPIALEPMRIDVVQTDRGQETRAYDARSLLDEGNDALMQGHYDQALAVYDHLLADFPDSRLTAAAHYNAGLACEGKRDFAAAAARYRNVLGVTPAAGGGDLVHAQLRLGAVLAEIEHFAESAEALERLLDRDDLSAPQRIEALARLGYALLESEDYPGAEEILRRGIAYHREIQGTTRLPGEAVYFVAMAQFYLAEIPHRQFLAVPLRYPEQQMAKDLDEKSQLFLLARDRYIKAVDYKNPFWATGAVYQIASMYKELWDAWMAVPIPAELDPEEAKEYVRQINSEPQLRKLLEKALYYHEKNLAMAKSIQVQTVWTERSEADHQVVQELLLRQQGGGMVPGAPAAPARPSGPEVPASPRTHTYPHTDLSPGEGNSP